MTKEQGVPTIALSPPSEHNSDNGHHDSPQLRKSQAPASNVLSCVNAFNEKKDQKDVGANSQKVVVDSDQKPSNVDIFSYYDMDGDGLLTKEEFGRAIRACGGCPNEKQVSDWFKERAVKEQVLESEKSPWHVPERKRTVKELLGGKDKGKPKDSYPTYVTKCGIKMQTFQDEIQRFVQESPGPNRAEILESLKTFTVQRDNQPGFILETETIRTVLGSMGPEHLEMNEVDGVLHGLEHKYGQIHFGSILDRLTKRDTPLSKLGLKGMHGHHHHHTTGHGLHSTHNHGSKPGPESAGIGSARGAQRKSEQRKSFFR